MFIVGKSFFSEILSKFNIKTIAPPKILQIKVFSKIGGPNVNLLFALEVVMGLCNPFSDLICYFTVKIKTNHTSLVTHNQD